ncbi:LysR family transcriptional regulator [Actinomadura madurae]|uniref:LysR family transcriptional regulator n=1 Tax=Actinomadura madurae TaxID=1993 RepID=UPI00399AB4E4
MSAPDNRISLQKLEVFCKVVDLGSVRRAAEELYISQPVVSAHLRSLQDRIGARLFERDGRGIALTEAGHEAYRWASEVLRGRLELQSSLQNLSGGTSGTVVVATSMSVGTYILTPVLIDFRREYEQASITLLISGVEQALETSLTGRADMCVIATDAVLDTNAFDAELIAEPGFCLVASTSSRLAGDLVRPEELNGMPFVCPPGGLAIRRAQDGALASIGVVNRRVEIELGNAEAIKQAVEADLGLGLLWRASVQKELDRGTLREVVIDGADLRDKLYLVTRRGKRPTPLQRRLAQAIRDDAVRRFGPFAPAE